MAGYIILVAAQETPRLYELRPCFVVLVALIVVAYIIARNMRDNEFW